MLYKFFILVGLIFSSCYNNINIEVEDLGVSIPESWTTSFPETKEFVGDWWIIFQDTLLIKYLDDFNKNSPNVLTLLQNQKVAKNSARINSSSIFPEINVNSRLDTNMQNLSGFGFASTLIPGDSSSSQENSDIDEVLSFGNTNVGIGLNLQWEVDIWGRLLNARKAAYKNYDAIVEDLTFLRFSSEIRATQLYFRGVESVAQYNLSRDSYESLVDIKNLVKDRYDKGLRSSLDYRLAENSVSNAIVLMETKKNQLKSINRELEILIGHYPQGELIKNGEIPRIMPGISRNLPASLIQKRPDIRSLIYKLESQSYRVAESKRNLLPGLFLNGNIGTSAQSIKDVVDKDYGIWNVGLNVTAPLFNANRLRSALEIEKATYEKSKQDLVKGILKAFSEVEQRLEMTESLEIQINALRDAVSQSQDVYDLSKERYDSGVTSLESVLNSQRQLNSVKSQYLTIQRLVIDNRLSLLLALGGDSTNLQN
jgi:NodT family efflux transporter outer membrane factor (OMF) lipoprotein